MEKKSSREQSRLQALADYQILDTPECPRFDRLTRLAAHSLSCPLAMVSLVAEDRQWFKSHFGTKLKETARDISFCTHTIEQDELFVVEDARLDERFKHSPLVTGATHCVFYAGVPLKTPSGERIGALCVVDHRPRQFFPQDAQTLFTIAESVMTQMELQKLHWELELKNRMIAHQSRMALIGEIASGVIHEIGNPMTIINYSIEELLQTQAQPQATLRLKTAAERINCSILSMRRYLHTQEGMELEKLNLFEQVVQTEELFGGLLAKEDIQLKLDVPENVWAIGHGQKLQQILTNLILNARDALSEINGEKEILVKVCEQEKGIQLIVKDSGPGVPEQHRQKIFHPFFTTKPPGKGTGLGLSLMSQLARECGGRLELARTNTGPGAEFILELKSALSD